MIKNILILGALTGAGIFIYNKWIKTDSATTEKKSGADGGCGCGCSEKKAVELKSNACGCGG